MISQIKAALPLRAELEVIAELQGKVAELEYFYEGFFCRKDEELKFVLYQQEEINGRKL